MCGIFAYLGKRTHAPQMVLEGLKKLEYRGYDSWGIAGYFTEEKRIHIEKHIGKISEVNQLKKELEEPCSLALGHSRWATHGGVTPWNAHPHSNEDDSIVVVHNGIFENYLEMKEQLIEKGYRFKSETDSEVLAHLIEDSKKENLFEKVRDALSQLHGRYAILAISQAERTLVAARRGSPLIIGTGEFEGEKEFFIASDVPAFLQYTTQVQYLDDEQMVVLRDGESNFFDIESGESLEKRIINIDWKLEESDKGAYPHFMIKEIMDQKETLSRAINIESAQLEELSKWIHKADRVFILGCGTAHFVSLIGEYLFSKIAKKLCFVKAASEMMHFEDFVDERSVMIAVSQSGETADLLEVIEHGKKKGAKLISVLNVESSTLARHSDAILALKVGVEKAVASTKATSAQIAILVLLAFASANKISEGRKCLIEAIASINDMLNPRYEEYILEIAKVLQTQKNILIIGRGLSYPIAMEAALKIKEVSYIHAEGFAGGELKHGHIALIEQGLACIVIAPMDDTRMDILSNAQELKARGALVVGISPENHPVFDHWIHAPEAQEANVVTHIIPAQLLAYQISVLREHNPDMPRNLAKSVTVK